MCRCAAVTAANADNLCSVCWQAWYVVARSAGILETKKAGGHQAQLASAGTAARSKARGITARYNISIWRGRHRVDTGAAT